MKDQKQIYFNQFKIMVDEMMEMYNIELPWWK